VSRRGGHREQTWSRQGADGEPTGNARGAHREQTAGAPRRKEVGRVPLEAGLLGGGRGWWGARSAALEECREDGQDGSSQGRKAKDEGG